jgi:hypothetical protein
MAAGGKLRAVLLPGVGDGPLVAFFCDDDKDEPFREILFAARQIVDYTQQGILSVARGAGRNPTVFSEEFVRQVRLADATYHCQDIEWLDFDYVTATSGPWIGLSVVAIGSNKQKRHRAAQAASLKTS